MKFRSNSWLAVSLLLLSLVLSACTAASDNNPEEVRSSDVQADSKESRTADGAEPDQNKKEDHQAFLYCKEAADKGDPQSQYAVADAYYFGHNAEQDYEKALVYFHRILSNPKADRRLRLKVKSEIGEMHYKGLGVIRNPQKGLHIMSQAAKEGDISTQVKLGTIYFENGGSENYKKSYYWFSKAAEAKSPADPASKARMKAVQSQARFMVGLMNFAGAGTSQKTDRAYKYFQPAAEDGSDDAKGVVGLMYIYGSGAAKDEEKGRQLIDEAAQKSKNAEKISRWLAENPDEKRFPDVFLLLTAKNK
ncbi:sel1 repeat family protein [bacterium]|nr:sel1 repeat family protein [bacterium]